MSSTPTISVILPVFNGARYIREALSSIQNQSFRDFELIIVDDGSTDDVPKIVKEIAARDARCKMISRENKGIVFSCNEALELARGEYIFRMDSDDVSRPLRFEKQLSYLQSNPGCVAVGTKALMIDPDGLPMMEYAMAFGHEEIDAAHLNGVASMVHPSVAMRRQALLGVGGYRQNCELAEDLDLWLRLAEVGRLENLPEVLLEYRQHLGSAGHAKRAKQLAAARTAVFEAQRRRGLPQTQDLVPVLPSDDLVVADIYRKWAWWALLGGHPATARKHAWRAVRLDPTSRDNIKLLVSALRGR